MADPLISPRPHLETRKSFIPKQPVELAEPKNDPITYEELAQHDGELHIHAALAALLDKSSSTKMLIDHRHQRRQTSPRRHQGHRLRREQEQSIRARRKLPRLRGQRPISSPRPLLSQA